MSEKVMKENVMNENVTSGSSGTETSCRCNKDGWVRKKLGEVCEILNGYAFNSKQFTQDSNYMPLLRIRDIKKGYTETFYNGDYPQEYIIHKGDYIIGLDGEFNIAEWSGVDALLNQRVCKLSIVDLNVNKRFILWYMPKKLKEIEDETPFVTVKHLSTKKIINIPVNLPSLPEQQHIVSELDCLNGIIEKQKEQLKQLDELAQSIFYDMFGNIEENKKNLPIMLLNDVCEFIKDGTHQTPTYTDDAENGVKFLSAKDVVKGYIDWSNIKYIPQELHYELSKRITPSKGDLLLCKNGTTGICAIVDTDEIFDIYVSLALLRLRQPSNSIYFHYAINNPITKDQFNKSLKGVGVPNLHLGEIKKAKILVPPLPLQQSFASKIEAIERQKELIKQSITETETLFNSRMDYYFG